MILIPAIDIAKGRCVRLKQGRLEEEIVYSLSPEQIAKRWESEGAEVLHVVDLDGAFSGELRNFDVIRQIRESTSLPIQVGGGIRRIRDIEQYLSIGVFQVILGSSLLTNPPFLQEACTSFPGRIAVGIDSQKGQVAIHGWSRITEEKAVEVASRLEGMGVRTIIFTDIQRDGMLSGPNIGAITEIVNRVKVPVIASGGITTLSHVAALMKISALSGMIVGRALYEGMLSFKEANALVRGASPC